jgi:hypothetical protein
MTMPAKAMQKTSEARNFVLRVIFISITSEPIEV